MQIDLHFTCIKREVFSRDNLILMQV